MNNKKILVVDPGSAKSGIALLDCSGEILEKRVCLNDQLVDYIEIIKKEHFLSVHLIGNKGAGKTIAKELRDKFPIDWVEADEHKSSEEGRILYWKDKQKGWKKILPSSLLIPSEPWDDWAAVVIGRRWLGCQKPELRKSSIFNDNKY